MLTEAALADSKPKPEIEEVLAKARELAAIDQERKTLDDLVDNHGKITRHEGRMSDTQAKPTRSIALKMRTAAALHKAADAAASEIAALGFDPIESVKALPLMLRLIDVTTPCGDDYPDGITTYELLARCRGEGRKA